MSNSFSHLCQRLIKILFHWSRRILKKYMTCRQSYGGVFQRVLPSIWTWAQKETNRKKDFFFFFFFFCPDSRRLKMKYITKAPGVSKRRSDFQNLNSFYFNTKVKGHQFAWTLKDFRVWGQKSICAKYDTSAFNSSREIGFSIFSQKGQRLIKAYYSNKLSRL